MPSRGTNGVGVQVEDTKICVVMVGLPARGKSYIAQKAQRYLQWLSIPAKTFNVGNYRRNDAPHPPADFFDTNQVSFSWSQLGESPAAM
jgi:6-phosphofructo-2-kinase/fructose-2,6-biphosphatase 2